jgi:hypothetical protein
VVLHESLRGDSNQHDVSRTTIATKLLVWRHPLSSSPVSGKKKDQCILCGKEEEDEKHFLLFCATLMEARLPYLTKIIFHCRQEGINIDPGNLTKLIINPHYSNCTPETQKISKNLIFKLHLRRSELLSPTAMPSSDSPVWEAVLTGRKKERKKMDFQPEYMHV